ncbi:MAG TPA: nucleotidyltransferase family protein [Polyangiales bacterium]
MSSVLQHAILFSAGLGTRMRPLTEHTPKALIQLAGKPLLDYALERFEAARCTRIVVNTHHLAEQIAAHLERRRSRAEIIRSHEPVLLETGGGAVRALPWLGSTAPFFCANMDTLWFDGPQTSALDRLRAAYDPEAMDALLLLQPLSRVVGYAKGGDFGLNAAGELTREGERPYVATGLYVLHPRTLAGRAAEPFSMRDVWFAPQRADGSLARIHGLVHDGDWLHVGTPGELAAAEAFMAQRAQAGAGR